MAPGSQATRVQNGVEIVFNSSGLPRGGVGPESPRTPQRAAPGTRRTAPGAARHAENSPWRCRSRRRPARGEQRPALQVPAPPGTRRTAPGAAGPGAARHTARSVLVLFVLCTQCSQRGRYRVSHLTPRTGPGSRAGGQCGAERAAAAPRTSLRWEGTQRVLPTSHMAEQGSRHPPLTADGPWGSSVQ
ncbi:unnamed protein product [Lepidochelys kempii]